MIKLSRIYVWDPGSKRHRIRNAVDNEFLCRGTSHYYIPVPMCPRSKSLYTLSEVVFPVESPSSFRFDT
jgi:hypothetical protein